MRRLILTAVLLAGLVEPAWAGWDEGWKAYKCRHYATAFREFKALADEGDARAQMTLPLMQMFDESVVSLEDSNEIQKWMFSIKKDLPEEVKWFREAGIRGDLKALTLLGFIHTEGMGVPQDFNEGEKLLLKAAEHGEVTAQKLLAFMYAFASKHIEFEKWARKAAEQGDPWGERALGSQVREVSPEGRRARGPLGSGHSRVPCDVANVTTTEWEEIDEKDARLVLNFPEFDSSSGKFEKTDIQHHTYEQGFWQAPGGLPIAELLLVWPLEGQASVLTEDSVLPIHEEITNTFERWGPLAVGDRGEATNHIGKLKFQHFAAAGKMQCVFMRQFKAVGDALLQGWFCASAFKKLSSDVLTQFFEGVGVKGWSLPRKLVGSPTATAERQDPDESRKPGTSFRDCRECPEMVVIPAGRFMMGGNGYSNELPVHMVTIGQPFAVGRFEVTFAEWEECIADGGCKLGPSDERWGMGDRPVINVSWDDTKAYVRWLSKQAGATYRLLSEAEWEYATRAGTTTRHYWGDKFNADYANFRGWPGHAFFRKTLPVGSFLANGFGLHDMSGNVWEWVEDCYHDRYDGAPADGAARASGDCGKRVIRGGSFSRGSLRSAERIWHPPEYGGDFLGFRVARTLVPTTPTTAAKQQPSVGRAPEPTPTGEVVQPAVGVYPKSYKSGETFRDCDVCPEMVVIPAGEFVMGSPASEKLRGPHEGPQHLVTIPHAFALGKYEVTFAEWDECIADGGCKRWRPPDEGRGWGSRPVINVTWDHANAYVEWLSRRTGKRYRLPSDAEWEYAARAGTTTARYWGDDADNGCGYANVSDLTARQKVSSFLNSIVFANCHDGYVYTAPVGSFRANLWGLHDMLGNVSEWTEDCWHNGGYVGAPADGSAWTTGGQCRLRVTRGGSWITVPRWVRSAHHGRYAANARGSSNGFRVARTLAE